MAMSPVSYYSHFSPERKECCGWGEKCEDCLCSRPRNVDSPKPPWPKSVCCWLNRKVGQLEHLRLLKVQTCTCTLSLSKQWWLVFTTAHGPCGFWALVLVEFPGWRVEYVSIAMSVDEKALGGGRLNSFAPAWTLIRCPPHCFLGQRRFYIYWDSC